MKTTACVFAGIGLTVGSGAASASEIAKGSHVLLKVMNSISTRTAQEGDQVYLQTVSPVTANDQIVVPSGSYVTGVVSHSKRSGRVSGRAELAIRIETLTLPGGKTIKLTPRLASVDDGSSDQKVTGGESTIKQGSNIGHDAAQVAILSGTGAAIGATVDRSIRGAGIGAGAGAAVGFASVLLTRGKEVELRQGTTLDVVFDRAVAIQE
jgi:hypothetical protein